ncbi:thioesterase domain-containing protein [Colletotrichum tofieldiae]|nr:thioesterase domain-containing protein [Colletotrichum tofieldiae]
MRGRPARLAARPDADAALPRARRRRHDLCVPLPLPLDRAVFGIANPRFHSGVPWEGGLPEMAATYLQMIRNTVTKSPEYPALAPCSSSAGRGGKRRRRILLGGWSLGGLLSLEIARQLGDEDEDMELVGLVMVDSVYPVWPRARGSRSGGSWTGRSPRRRT